MADKEQQRQKDSHKDMLRAQAAVLLSQAQGQAIDIQRAMSMAQGNPALLARLVAAAAHIDGIVSALSQALSSSQFPLHGAALVALQGGLQPGATAALLSEAAAQSGHAAAGTATPAQLAEVKTASTETRQEVESLSRDLFDRHIFDRYLHFSSAEDEAAFRRREADAKTYIHDQLAKGTPEGNLNAGGGTLGTMLDAHAHGAGDSPEFMPRWDALAAKTQRQYAAMRAAGQSTTEFEHRLGESVRRFLKDEKQLPEAEIERRMAAHANPLEAVKGMLGNDRNSRSLERKTERADTPEAAPGSLHGTVKSAGAAITEIGNLDALGAKLKAAGMKMTDTGEKISTHGLAVPKPAGQVGQSVGG